MATVKEQISMQVQQLQATEARCNIKLLNAQRRKAQRLKAAKREADAEIQSYKNEREKSYREYEAKIFGSRTDMEVIIQKGKEQKFREISDSVKKNRAAAVSSILELVKEINVDLHENLNV